MNTRLFIAQHPLPLPHTTCMTEESLQNRSLDEETFIVSNVPTDHACILAPEINWYLKCVQTPNMDALELLYTAREMRFDYLQPSKQQPIAPSLFVLGDSSMAEDFCLYANQNGFNAVLLDSSKVASISGHFGAFALHFQDDTIRIYAQGVLFVELPDLLRYKGIESAGDFASKEELLSTLRHNLGTYSYHDILNFDPTYCQYENRREKCCLACTTVCPTFGIYNDDSNNTLHTSSIDCIACGACLSVCPTGAIEFKHFPRTLFFNIARLYKDWQILLLDEASLSRMQDLTICLKERILPFVIPQSNALTPLHLITLIQETGSSLAFFEPSKALQDTIETVNTITNKAYGMQGIYPASCDNLQESLDSLKAIQGSSYHYTPRERDHDRTIFAERLRYIIKDKDLGHLPYNPNFRYGEIRLKEGCTLCLSCVGACNVGALGANEQNFTLTFNPSLCTTCEYCLLSCPEHVMILERNGIPLNPTWFETKILAKDQPFKCVECGTPFATTQSIKKISDMLAAQFGHDEKKLRTLSCCPDCKVRVMAGITQENSKERS